MQIMYNTVGIYDTSIKKKKSIFAYEINRKSMA